MSVSWRTRLGIGLLFVGVAPMVHCGGGISLDAPRSDGSPAPQGGGATLPGPGSNGPALPQPTTAIGNCPRGTWCSHTDMVTQASFRAAYSPDESADTWAITEVGTIYRYDRSSWSLARAPKTEDLVTGTGIDGTSANDVWAAYTHGGLVNAAPGGFSEDRTSHLAHWNGSAWSDSPALKGRVLAVRAIAPNHVFAVGDSIWQLTDGKWEAATGLPAEVATGVTWVAVHGTTPSDVFAVTSAGRIAHYNGAAWELANVDALVKLWEPVGLFSGTVGEVELVYKSADASAPLRWMLVDAAGSRDVSFSALPSSCDPTRRYTGAFAGFHVGSRVYGTRQDDGTRGHTTLWVGDANNCARRLVRYFKGSRDGLTTAEYLGVDSWGATAAAGSRWVGQSGRVWTQNGTPRGSNELANQRVVSVAAAPDEVWAVIETSKPTFGATTMRHFKGAFSESLDAIPLGADNRSVVGARTKLLFSNGTLFGIGPGFSKFDGHAFQRLPVDCVGCEKSDVVSVGLPGREEPWVLGWSLSTTHVYRWDGGSWALVADVPGLYRNVRGSGPNDIYLWGTRPYEDSDPATQTAFDQFLAHWDGHGTTLTDNPIIDHSIPPDFRVDWLSAPGNAWALDDYSVHLTSFAGVTKGVEILLPKWWHGWTVLAPSWLFPGMLHFDGTKLVDTGLVRDRWYVNTAALTGETLFVGGDSGMLLEYTP